MIWLPFGACKMAGWLILDFCLALFFIQKISNKRILTFILVVQVIVTLLMFLILNTFIVKTAPVTTFSVEHYYSQIGSNIFTPVL